MLFLGTEKYPNENEYSSFLNEHGKFHISIIADDGP